MSLLEKITPVVLTWNEEPNIKRVFDPLAWAREVVVVDSGSNDGTLELLAGYPNVRVTAHPFRSHADQWNRAVEATDIVTPWVLTLDADYVMSDSLVEELRRLEPSDRVSGLSARFIYKSLGRELRGSLYPPRVVLFRRGRGHFVQEGHTQRLIVDGAVVRLGSPIFHDDRKSLARWLANQERYMSLEADRLLSARLANLNWVDRVRLMGIAPALVAAYALFVKGCILDGRAGLRYTLERVVAEALLVMRLWEIRMGGG